MLFQFITRFAQLLLPQFLLRDVPVDPPQPHYISLPVPHRHLRDRRPRHCAVRRDLSLNLVDQRLARLDYPLLILEKLPGLFRGVEIKIRLADGLLRILHAHAFGQRAAQPQEPGLGVLEINPVGNIVQNRLHLAMDIGQRLTGLLQFSAAGKCSFGGILRHNPASLFFAMGRQFPLTYISE